MANNRRLQSHGFSAGVLQVAISGGAGVVVSGAVLMQSNPAAGTVPVRLPGNTRYRIIGATVALALVGGPNTDGAGGWEVNPKTEGGCIELWWANDATLATPAAVRASQFLARFPLPGGYVPLDIELPRSTILALYAVAQCDATGTVNGSLCGDSTHCMGMASLHLQIEEIPA